MQYRLDFHCHTQSNKFFKDSLPALSQHLSSPSPVSEPTAKLLEYVEYVCTQCNYRDTPLLRKVGSTCGCKACILLYKIGAVSQQLGQLASM